MKRSMVALALATTVVGVAAFGAGCTGGGDGGGGQYGGAIELLWTSAGGYSYGSAGAFFVTSAGTADTSVALEQCLSTSPTPTPSATNTPNPIPLDAGGVNLVSGSTTISLADSGGYYYTAAPPTVPTNASYDVDITGGADIPATSWAGALFMPMVPTLDPGGFTFPASGAIDITWGAGGGDFASILVYSGSTVVAVCNANDDGAFTIPADAADAIPAGSGYVIVTSYTEGHKNLQGRNVLLAGGASSYTTWTK